jgi:hypothetical protein
MKPKNLLVGLIIAAGTLVVVKPAHAEYVDVNQNINSIYHGDPQYHWRENRCNDRRFEHNDRSCSYYQSRFRRIVDHDWDDRYYENRHRSLRNLERYERNRYYNYDRHNRRYRYHDRDDRGGFQIRIGF